MKKIVVAGGGVLGSQIAFQCAYIGYDVTIYLRTKESAQRCQTKIDGLKKSYILAIDNMSSGKEWSFGISDAESFNKDDCLSHVNNAYENIKLETNLNQALENADILIESLKEDIKEKCAFYESIKDLLEEKTLVLTNSSTLLPSNMAKSTGRKEKFLALHFANSIWKNNTAEVMGHSDTSEESFKTTVEFAKSINMIPLEIRKEKSGYLLNSLLVPFLLSAFDLYANGVSDPQTIDKAWMKGTGAPHGPFMIMDTVGLETVKNIVLQYQKVPKLLNPLLSKMMMPYNFKGILEICERYISENKMGKSTGEGVYKYN